MNKHIHVLCLNDFPEEVFVDGTLADRAQKKRNDPEKGRYYHVRWVPLNEEAAR